MPEITYQMLDLEIQRLAALRNEIEPILPQLKVEKNQAAANLKKYEDELTAAEDKVRSMALEYVTQTGDLTPHPSLTFRRTTKLVYDKEQVVSELIDVTIQGYETFKGDLEELRRHLHNFQSGQFGRYLKLAITLDTRLFEKDFKDGNLQWAQVEEVSAPTIAIAKLGDVIIKKELEGKTDAS